MHALAALLFVTLAFAAAQDGDLSAHIVGGTNAPAGKYTYQVSLRITDSHLCGGSIINKGTILTAAHCLEGKEDRMKNMKAHVGTIFLNETGYAYEIERFVIHKQYDTTQLVNDIALIHLKTPIEYNKLVQPIKLATIDTGIEGKTCKLTGWGRLSVRGSLPNNLQEIDLLIFPQNQCRRVVVQPSVRDSHICTFTKAGEGACYGDSGGPLVVKGSQVGIVSFGRPCARGFPDVYTRVSSFRTWIMQNMKLE